LRNRYWLRHAPPGDMRVAKDYNRAHGYKCARCGFEAMSARLFKRAPSGNAVCRDAKRCARMRETKA